MSVTLTDTAAREIANIIKGQGLEEDKIFLRVGVKGGGCSGFSYLLDLTETARDSDESWEATFTLPANGAAKTKANGVSLGVSAGEPSGENGEDGATATESAEGRDIRIRIVCDPKSYLYLNGTAIDFKDEIMGRGFVFNNPNATTTCGCGSSFAT